MSKTYKLNIPKNTNAKVLNTTIKDDVIKIEVS